MIPLIENMKTGKTNLLLGSSYWRGTKGAAWALVLLFLELGAVTQVRSVCPNPSGCTLFICVLFYMYGILQFKKFLKLSN